MNKRKDYMRLFCQYAKKNSVWFSIYANGDIDEITFCDYSIDSVFMDQCEDFTLKFGSKKAYEWLVKTHQEIVEEGARQ